jgi:polysaccharide biosynthesis transport protein
MNNNRQAESSATMTLGDVYFVLFRHKWKIIILSLAGIVAASAFYLLRPPLYQSESELLIRYISDNRPVSSSTDNTTMTTPSNPGGGIIDSEIKILTSFDLAQQVASTIGPEKILAKAGGGKDVIAAAAVVRSGLNVEAGDRSSVIQITFKHPDSTIVQPVLNEIITDYLNKHSEIHQAFGTEDDYLTEETTQLRSEIAKTEMDLMSAKTNVGIISLDDTKRGMSEQIEKIQGQLSDVEVELAFRQGLSGSTNASTNAVASASPTATNTPAGDIPTEQVNAYNLVRARLAILEQKNGEFIGDGYTEDNVLVKDLAGQIAKVREQKKSLEDKYPGLTNLGSAAPETSETTPTDAHPLLTPEESGRLITLLQTKAQILKERLGRLVAESIAVGEAEPKILDLQRKEQIQENNLQYLLKSLADARINEALGAGKISNIKSIEQPTPPAPADTKRLKMAGMMLAGGILGGLALAFLIEMFLDRSVKRPTEIETRLKIPLFLSIPDVHRNGSRKETKRRQLQIENTEGAGAGAVNGKDSGKNGNLEVAPWSANHSLRAFYEALRDRIVVHFEAKELTRKPKLVAVTSANRGAGVTTIAMGLAASLSETGEGNVLLVDMNVEQGAVQQFYKGSPGCALDDAFESEKRDGALVQDNLYVVSDSTSNGDKLPRIMPKRFSSLLPKFKASDYDYIIFDMPPVNQTSVTPRLAGHMDMVLLVVEAEKTDRDIVRRANSLLGESKANVIAVLNKAKKYVPEKLHQEYLSDR